MEEPKIDELQRALGILNDAAMAGKDFVWEQAPLVAREVVYWSIGSNAVLLLFTVAILIVVAMLVKWAYPKVAQGLDNGSEFSIAVVIVGGFAALFGVPFALALLFNSTSSVVKGVVAPRLVIIDYVSEKVGGCAKR